MKNVSKVLVIGGGLAGSSTGCYLQFSGFKTIIFEAHSIPNSLLTGQSRNGYNIDEGIPAFLGTRVSLVLQVSGKKDFYSNPR